LDKGIEHLSDERFVSEKLAEKAVIGRLTGNSFDPLEGIKAAQFSELGVSKKFSTEAFDAGMVEDDTGQ
jgi:hypothetical protein